MKMVKKMLIGVCLGMMMMAAGCGSSETLPQGKVVKGPVYGATVTDSKGTVVGKTDVNGNFPLTGVAPYTTTGGTYIPIGQTAPVAAPNMKSAPGVSQITPLSTLFADADAATQTAITALLAKAGATLSTDMSSKSSDAALQTILALNESLQSAKQAGASAADLISFVKAIDITVALTPASVSTAATKSLPAAVATAVTTTVTAVNNAPVGPTPIVKPTGSTGGSNGSTTQG